MHALLAHAYHLMQLAIHMLTSPVWRPFGVCLAAAMLGRIGGFARNARAAAFPSAVAVALGWVVMAPPNAWPLTPVARLAGLAAIVAAATAWRAGGKVGWTPLVLAAACGAWWLRGAPLQGPAIVNCMPVFLGLVAGLGLARRLVRRDTGWATLAGALSLAASLMITGAAPHWARAALVVAVATGALVGLPEAMAGLAYALVMAAASALVASDRGRLVPVDAACATPFVAWLLVPRLAPRLARHGSLAAAALVAVFCAALAWAANRVLIG